MKSGNRAIQDLARGECTSLLLAAGSRTRQYSPKLKAYSLSMRGLSPEKSTFGDTARLWPRNMFKRMFAYLTMSSSRNSGSLNGSEQMV